MNDSLRPLPFPPLEAVLPETPEPIVLPQPLPPPLSTATVPPIAGPDWRPTRSGARS